MNKAAWGALILLGALPLAQADQYRSETRELSSTPSKQVQQNAQELLKNATDPYAKSLLLRDLAAAAVAKKDYAQAAKYLEQALAQNGMSGLAVEQMKKDLSQVLMATGNYKDMIPQLEAQVRSGNAAAETLIALGAAYIEKKRFKEALPLLQKGVASTKTPDVSWRRALIAAMFATDKQKDALPLLEQLLREDPTHGEDWLRLAALQLKYGSKERAQATMELASRLGFLVTEEDRLRLVTLTAQLGAPFEAASVMQGWMQSGALNKSATNWKTLATMWINARETTLAIPALDQALALAPSAELYQQLAQMRMNREQYAEAATALERAIGMGAKSGPLFMTLGMARYQQADTDGAMQAFGAASAYPQSRKLAADWARYLQTGKARDQALAAAAQRHERNEEVSLSARLLGGSISVSAGVDAAVPGARGSSSGGGLTPIGAESSPNNDNSIPAWTGGLSKPPASYKGGGRLTDPYPEDKPLFTITAANAAQYRDKLTRSHLVLLAKYPSYKIPVFATRRSVAYPKAIYDATQSNIGKAKLLGSDALQGAHLGFPFPKPQTGVEILWNHRVRYRGNTLTSQSTQAVVETDGDVHTLKQTEKVFYRYANLQAAVDIAKENILLYYLTWFGKTKNDVDFVVLVHETANSIENPRGIWVVPPKVPKVFRIPPVGYDQPFPGSEALMFIDMVDMYNGAFDRYVWRLVGKRELYIPYNSYRISDGRYTYSQLLTKNHFNQDSTRYELHRVWMIEATERDGKSHKFGKRTFYVDEDSWNVVLVENEDHEGKLWRFQEGHLLPSYANQTANCAPVVLYDLKDGRYFVNRLLGEDTPIQYDQKMTTGEFMPASLSRYTR